MRGSDYAIFAFVAIGVIAIILIVSVPLSTTTTAPASVTNLPVCGTTALWTQVLVYGGNPSGGASVAIVQPGGFWTSSTTYIPNTYLNIVGQGGGGGSRTGPNNQLVLPSSFPSGISCWNVGALP